MHRLSIVRQAAVVVALLSPTYAQDLIGLSTDNRLVPMRIASPLQVGPATAITGLQPGESVLGIDFRPATGELYGLGSQNRIYRIDPGTGVATQAGAVLTTPLAGTEFGFDFNPTVDRIRVVSDSGQNLRLHPDTGAVAAIDGTLAYAATDVNFGIAPLVAGSAYTNSFAGATSTTLYGIDSNLDILVSQVPPNSGTLNTIGGLGRDVTSVAGFDIAPGGAAYAVLNTSLNTGNGTSQLHRIDLMTGQATLLGTIQNANASSRLRGLAVLPPRAETDLVALTSDGRIATFAAATPWGPQVIASITGMQPGEALLAIDFRPATGQLYGLGTQSRLYTIDPSTGVATAVGGALNPPLSGTEFGFDFNPTVDRIRIVSDFDQDLRVHPDTGVVVSVDGTIAYASGDVNFGADPGVTASAYTNSIAGATSTMLYGIDTRLDVLVSQVPPNNGTLNTIGSLGRDFIAAGGFDIGTDGQAFAALTDTSDSHFYRVDLATAGLTDLGAIGLPVGASIRGLAVRSGQGLELFGAATAGCRGPAWLGAAGVPYAGNTDFALIPHHAEANTIGFLALTQLRRTVPVNYQGIDVWVNSPTLLVLSIGVTDANGQSRYPMPLNGAWFGLPLHYQWIGADMCGPNGLAATAGLTVIVQ